MLHALRPLVLALCSAPFVAHAAPFSFESAPGRLPKAVVPIDYAIAITPDAALRTLRGTETVTLDVREATSTIVFNSLQQTLSNVRLDGKPVARVVSDDKQQLTTVTLRKIAAPGRHTLSFAYTGRIQTTPVGLFVQPFVAPGGGKGRLLSTQFEATDARRMFPCWDEPSFRATFELTATVPADWDTVANMPAARRVVHGKTATTTFERTPKMPTYLVEFTAGVLGSIQAESGGVKFGVWAVRGQEQGGQQALANAQQILADYNDYFGVRYPLPKLDSIAIPGGFGGAMENWGAITYNDQALLLTPSSTLRDRQRVFSIQAHEMAHQWFGDLVTMGWWDDLWLNESFASWRAAKETDERHPEWHWWEREDASREDAMGADARLSSHAIEQHVTNENEATTAFDPQITYSKGQAVLRMFEAYLGEARFRDGIRRHMATHAYSNASSTDLWNSLGAAGGVDVAAIAGAWTSQAGFPLVTATAQCNADGRRRLTLTQQRFLLSGTDAAAARWQIPLQMRIGTQAAAQPVLLTEDGQSIAAGRCEEALSLNASALGFYRVAYDAPTLALATREFARLPSGDRIALLDDQWALVQANRQTLPQYLALVEAMGSDLNERAWVQVTEALETLEQTLRGTASHDAFTAYATSVVRPVAARLGHSGPADEDPGLRRLRTRVLTVMGQWGDPATVAYARERFAAYLADHKAVTPDEQGAMLAVVARHADEATFEQLHALVRAAGNETELRRVLSALAAVGDPALAAQAGRIVMSDEVPAQAAGVRMGLVMQLSELHPQLSWKLYSENVDALKAPIQPFGDFTVAQTSPEVYWNALPLSTLEAWVRSKVPADLSPNIARGMETARFKLARRDALTKAAQDYLATRGAGTAKS